MVGEVEAEWMWSCVGEGAVLEREEGRWDGEEASGCCVSTMSSCAGEEEEEEEEDEEDVGEGSLVEGVVVVVEVGVCAGSEVF